MYYDCFLCSSILDPRHFLHNKTSVLNKSRRNYIIRKEGIIIESTSRLDIFFFSIKLRLINNVLVLPETKHFFSSVSSFPRKSIYRYTNIFPKRQFPSKCETYWPLQLLQMSKPFNCLREVPYAGRNCVKR